MNGFIKNVMRPGNEIADLKGLMSVDVYGEPEEFKELEMLTGGLLIY